MSVIIYASDPQFHQPSYEQGYNDGSQSTLQDCNAFMYEELGRDMRRIINRLNESEQILADEDEHSLKRVQEWLDFWS